MSLIDRLYQLELFAVPLMGRATALIKQKDVQRFEEKWPKWSRRLQHFPDMQNLIFGTICQTAFNKNTVDPAGVKILHAFVKYSKITQNPLVNSELNVLLINHHWEAIKYLNSIVPLDKASAAIVACAMVHEHISNGWPSKKDAPISIAEIIEFCSAHAIDYRTPVAYLHDDSVFSMAHNQHKKWAQDFNFQYRVGSSANALLFGGKMATTLPGFQYDNLWQAIAKDADQSLVAFAAAQSPLKHVSEVYDLMNRTKPLSAETVRPLLDKKFDKKTFSHALSAFLGVAFTNTKNFEKLLKASHPAFFDAYDLARTQQLNERMRQRLNKAVALQPTVDNTPKPRRKM